MCRSFDFSIRYILCPQYKYYCTYNAVSQSLNFYCFVNFINHLFKSVKL